MSQPQVEERPGAEPPVVKVAAFDFDGTLTVRDTMVPFLVRTHGRRQVAAAAVREVPLLVRSPPGAGPRDALKTATVGRLFRGMSAGRLAELGEAYAATLAAGLRPASVARLRRHQADGHATVVVSASLAAYVRPVAATLGIDDVLAVELSADRQGMLTGEVEGGLNTRGPHKVTRLRTWVQERFGTGTPIELWAYGDSSGDRQLLAAADHPTWID